MRSSRDLIGTCGYEETEADVIGLKGISINRDGEFSLLTSLIDSAFAYFIYLKLKL